MLAEPDLNKRLELFKKMLDGSVSVREAEGRVGGKNISKRSTSKKDPNILAHEKKLREVLGTKVEITDSSGKGKISISYYSREEFLDLLDRLIG